MTFTAETQAEVKRALADMAGAGLPGDGAATNAVLTRTTPAAYNVATGASATTTTSYNVIAMVEEVDQRDPINMQVRPVRQAIIAAGAFTVQENDTLAILGTTYTVARVRAQAVGGAVASWIAELRT